MKDSLENTISLHQKTTPFVSESERKRFSLAEIDFFQYWSPSNCNNGFKESVNERISFPLNRKPVAIDRNKGFV